MQTINTSVGQTLLDVAMQHAGQIDTLFMIAEDNGRSITDLLQPGGSLEIDNDQENINKKNLDYYNANKVSPSSNPSVAPEGLDFEYLEYPEPEFIIE